MLTTRSSPIAEQPPPAPRSVARAPNSARSHARGIERIPEVLALPAIKARHARDFVAIRRERHLKGSDRMRPCDPPHQLLAAYTPSDCTAATCVAVRLDVATLVFARDKRALLNERESEGLGYVDLVLRPDPCSRPRRRVTGCRGHACDGQCDSCCDQCPNGHGAASVPLPRMGIKRAGAGRKAGSSRDSSRYRNTKGPVSRAYRGTAAAAIPRWRRSSGSKSGRWKLLPAWTDGGGATTVRLLRRPPTITTGCSRGRGTGPQTGCP